MSMVIYMNFKKIYLEITNVCNLSCDFCIKNSRPRKIMDINSFNIVLDKLNGFTDYLYFHILGEPLIHPKINEFIDLGTKKGYKINITTNGYLISNIFDNKNVRQVNISLHSFDLKYKKSLDEYLNDIYSYIDKNKENTYISLRLWTKSNYSNLIIENLSKKFNIDIEKFQKISNIALDKNVYLNFSKEFIWPDLNNNYYSTKGKCYALKDHLGILSDGTIVPCCLDSKGIINLGNIYKDNLEDVINSKRYQNMFNEFKNNKKKEELCRHCKFL